MCGIIGVASTKPVLSCDWLKTGRDTMLHRGPDDAGLWWSDDTRVGLGHRRLSILDLTSAGHQPMLDHSGRYAIVFNGEIYNFPELRAELAALGNIFVSASDTEVVLSAYKTWGNNCLTRFDGMFALAIYDKLRQVLVLARDRAGEKPIFYRLSSGELRFASELKALLADPDLSRNVHHESLECYLYMGYVPGERCILKGFNKLPPAHVMEFDLNSNAARIWKYWQLPEPTDAGNVPDEYLVGKLHSLLQDSIKRQLVADVPVGVLLSGGVDSSLITAIAAQQSSHLRTFTVRFPGHGKHDETDHARLIANHFSTEHIELEADPASVQLICRLAQQFDEPIIDSSMIPMFMVSELVREHCKVALGGDGGDELFGGYGHYSRLLRISDWMKNIPPPARAWLSLAASRAFPLGFKGRNWMQACGSDMTTGVPLVACYFDMPTRQRLLRAHMASTPIPETTIAKYTPIDSDLLQRATRLDFSTFLCEDILVKVDRASMLNSLEIRAPFLSHHLIEFAFHEVPSSLKATSKAGKVLLKKLTETILPSEFNKNRKQGFSIPLSSWLKRGKYRNFFNDVLLSQDCVFDRSAVQDLLRGQDIGLNNAERLFGLVIFELWRKHYKVSM